MPLVEPFVSANVRETERRCVIVELSAQIDGAEHTGWGELAALAEPTYVSEYLAGEVDVLRRFLVPRLVGIELGPQDVHRLLAPVKGHRMAKAALEMAVLDAACRAAGVSMATQLGAPVERVPAGVAIGLQDDPRALVDVVGRYLADGYVRCKLKIEPGRDEAYLAAVRRAHGPDLALQVDANGSYTPDDVGVLRRLDRFGLQCIEQPLDAADWAGHAALARQLSTPICLDESIGSPAELAAALACGACSVVNVKVARVGGPLQARAVIDVAAAHAAGAWIGGMLETGIGRAANLAVAALSGCTLPGDVSASARFYACDITPPFVVEDGAIAVPTGPGLGVEPIRWVMAEVTESVEEITCRGDRMGQARGT